MLKEQLLVCEVCVELTMVIASCEIDRVLRGSRNTVREMGSGAKTLASTTLRAVTLGIRPINP